MGLDQTGQQNFIDKAIIVRDCPPAVPAVGPTHADDQAILDRYMRGDRAVVVHRDNFSSAVDGDQIDVFLFYFNALRRIRSDFPKLWKGKTLVDALGKS